MAPAPGHSLLLVVLGVLALNHLARGQLSSTLILTQDNTVWSCRCPGDIRDCDCSLASLLCRCDRALPLAPPATCRPPRPPDHLVRPPRRPGPPAELHRVRDLRLSLCSAHTLPARSLALCGLERLRVTLPAQAGRPVAPHSLLLLREPREQHPEQPAGPPGGPSCADIGLLDMGLFNRGSGLKAYSVQDVADFAGTFPCLSDLSASPSVSNKSHVVTLVY